MENKNPFHLLHTIEKETFLKQIKFMQTMGNIISINELLNNNLDGNNFIIAFDDVSSSIKEITPFLFNNKIPFVISPCTGITSNGYGIRDKVYFIIKNISNTDIYDFIIKRVDKKITIKQSSFSFYYFSKSSIFDNVFMEKEIIDPLFNSLGLKEEDLKKYNAYLNWDEIRDIYQKNELVTITNHSHTHKNFNNEATDIIENDLKKSNEIFNKEINFEPNLFTVPFGGYTSNLSNKLDILLKKYNFNAKIWVKSGNELLVQSKTVPNLFKIHTPNSYIKFIYSFISNRKAIKNINSL